MPPEVYGPAGALVILGIAVGVLWRLHDASDKRQRIETLFWRNLALRGTTLADHGTQVAAKVAGVQEPADDG